MNQYIGTKMIKAEPMTRSAYNTLRGWTLPTDENGDDKGYLVECLDGGKPNVPLYAGYVSWSPKEQFEKAYRSCNAMTFGLAIEALKLGKRVARAGWNCKGMWLALTLSIHDIPRAGTTQPVYRLTLDDDGAGATALPWIGMKTADNKFVPWLASQTDMLAEDWQIVE
ncbi:MAG: hypothetical protein RLZZ22_144 [Pseudomonadota bacterium]|jgi:hypothetical protein